MQPRFIAAMRQQRGGAPAANQTISAINPNHGTDGTSVTLTGTGFLTAGTNFKLSGTDMSNSVTNDTTATATIPPDFTPGPYDVEVYGAGDVLKDALIGGFTYE